MNARVFAFLFLLLTGCNQETAYHVKEYEYDMQFSLNLFRSNLKPNVRKVEVYSDNSGDGFPQPYKVLSGRKLVWSTQDSIVINDFLREIRTEQPYPPGRKVSSQDVTLHIVLWGDSDKIGYGRCRWHSNESVPYGFTIPFGSEGAYSFTETLLPWIEKQNRMGSITNRQSDRNGVPTNE